MSKIQGLNYLNNNQASVLQHFGTKSLKVIVSIYHVTV